MKRLVHKIVATGLLLLTCGCTDRVVSAQSPQQTITAENLRALLQGVVPEEMTNRHAPGAVVVIVKDGQTIFKQGFGVTNLESKIPVDADGTVFRVASVSKPVTIFTTLRLVEEGKLQIGADVNQYLKGFRIPEAFGQPVTLVNLFTHTGGFDDREIGFTAKTPAEVLPLGEYLRLRMPPRVSAPGRYYSYSNHGISLVGSVDESVEGKPYREVAEEQTFGPLRMSSSSYGYSEKLAGRRATGYVWEKGGYKRVEDDYVQLVPAVSLETTGGDMARFMTAVLGGGRIDGKQVLSEELAAKMVTRQFTMDERLPGASYGFYEAMHGKKTLFIQNGEWFGVASLLVLVPEEHLGYFIATNSEEVGVTYAVLGKFLDAYYPVEKTSTAAMAMGDVKEYEGRYMMEHYPRRSIEKIAQLLRESSVRRGAGAGELRIVATDFGNVNVQAAGKDFFSGDAESPQVAFGRDENGRVNYMFIDHQAFRKLEWYEWPKLHIGLFVLFGLVFGAGMLAWPARRIAEKRTELGGGAGVHNLRTASWVSLIGLLNFVFLAGITLSFYFREPLGYYFHFPLVMQVLLFVPLVTAMLALWGCYQLLLTRGADYGRKAWRSVYWSVAIAALLFIPFLSYWHMWGFQS